MIDINPFKKQLDVRHLIHEDYKYAAMDWDRTWWVFTHKPNCVDDMWDVKDGHFMRLFLPPTEEIDWRKSLMQVEVPKKVLTSEVA